MNANASPGRGILLFVAAMAIFAVQDGITKNISNLYSPAQILMVRYAVFVLLAALIATRKGTFKASLRSNRPVLQVVRSVVVITESAFFVLAVQTMPLADAHAIIASTPLFVTAMAMFFLHEQVGVRRWTAVIVGFGGILIILRPGAGVVEPSALFALATAVGYALYIVLTRLVGQTDTAETSTLYMGFTGFLIAALFAPFFWTTPDLAGWGQMAAISVMAATAHIFLIMALQRAQASVLQPFSYMLLVWATVVGFVFFGDLPDTYTIIGAAIIVATGLYTIYREHTHKAKTVLVPPVK
ncbi:MAG: DMT family transporter [Alphaproteobacteria bacterium]